MMDDSKHSAYVSLAKQALETYIINGETISPMPGLPKDMIERKAGVFVLIKNNGQLRGCIGTIRPTRENIAQEIIQNAIAAGTRDPRFYPVSRDELKNLSYLVDVLKEFEPVETIKKLDKDKYGVLVTSQNRSGLILPGLEGIETVKHQIYIALERAGIGPSEPYDIYRFKVERYS